MIHNAFKLDSMLQMTKSIFTVPKMDCPSEESLIRLTLGRFEDITKLEFDINERKLKVFHSGDSRKISEALTPLGFGAKLIAEEKLNPSEVKRMDLTSKKS